MGEEVLEKDYPNPITNGYASMANDSVGHGLLPQMVNSYYDDGGSWMFSSHDVPILIGAAAGLSSHLIYWN